MSETTEPTELTALDALEKVVASLGGSPRDGQIDLTEDVEEAMGTGGHLAAIAPTGTGKSLAYLVPAILRARKGERTIISTDSLALQNQIEDEDAKAVVDSVSADAPPKIRTLKGFSNYVCQTSLNDFTSKLLGAFAETLNRGMTPEEGSPSLAALCDTMEAHAIRAEDIPHVTGWLERLAQVAPAADVRHLLDYTPPTLVSAADTAATLSWAWSVSGKPPRESDVNLYPGTMEPAVRSEITLSTDACAGQKCPLFDFCAPRGSRREAGDADIVVTNHSLIGVQAAKSVPAAFGSKSLGNFHHVIIDEAHTLPAKVRDQGTESFGAAEARRIQSTFTKLDQTVFSRSPEIQAVSNAAPEIGKQAEALALSAVPASKHRFEGDHEITESTKIDFDELDSLIAYLHKVRNLSRILRESGTLGEPDERRLRGLIGHLDRCSDALEEVKEGRPGVARWVSLRKSRGKSGGMIAAFNASPVDVSSLLRHNVYRQKVVDVEKMNPKTIPGAVYQGEMKDEPLTVSEQRNVELGKGRPQDRAKDVDDSGYEVIFDSSVVCMSATLPGNYWIEAGLSCREEVVYDSPFDEAYELSAAFSPKPDDSDSDAMMSDRWGKRKFDQKLHPAWAIGAMGDLVEANGGRALILSATAEAGRSYVTWLRQRLAGKSITVLSQWEGKSKDILTEEFRAEETSVLVGTRGYMTGINVKGEALSLVIIDRVPRSPGNLIDDARAEALADSLDMSEWESKDRIYSADAELLLEQAFGRLIRQIDDTGMVALMDPRIAKSSPLTMRGPARKRYASLLTKFGNVYSDPAKAVEWLRSKREGA